MEKACHVHRVTSLFSTNAGVAARATRAGRLQSTTQRVGPQLTELLSNGELEMRRKEKGKGHFIATP